MLRQHGFSVALFDSMLEDPEHGFQAALARHRPRVVTLYEDNFNFLSKMCLSRMRRAAYGMIDAARGSGATVVVNGSDSADHVEEYLRRGADYVLLGEAEWTLLELVRALFEDSTRPLGHIPGVTFLQRGTGELFQTSARPHLRDLDTLPLPARDLVHNEAYRKAWKARHGFFSLNLVASRGCPYRCNWCARPIYGDSFHVRSAESVAEEMKDLKETYGAEHLWFTDDVFGLRHHWITELADAVEQRAASVPFKIQSRVNLITRETAAGLRRAGCTEVWMGIESGSQKILDSMDKGTCVGQVAPACEHLRQQGIRACFFLQFGYPGETWRDIQETIQLVRRTRPDGIGVSVSYPLPGTRFYERVREELGEKQNWVDSDDLTVMFRGTYTNEFYRALRDALHAEVNTWSTQSALPEICDGLQVHAGSADATQVADLWTTVLQMEKTCRNVQPTLAL
jgi:anaerobic magnesium-protoporphyrin IX monomethyl ester cyclase